MTYRITRGAVGVVEPPGPTDPETLAMDEKAKLATEFTALKAKANTAKTGMDAIDFAT